MKSVADKTPCLGFIYGNRDFFPDHLITEARADFAKGEYRWVASVTSQLVFADPTSRTGRRINVSLVAPTDLEQDARGNVIGFAPRT